MALVWLDVADYAEVYNDIRAAIAVDLTAASLPDSVIARAIFLNVAEMAIKALDENWETDNVDADTYAILQMAAVFWAASLLLPKLPRLVRESIGQGEHSYQLESLPIRDLVGLLRGEAQALVSGIVDGTASLRPTLFTVAHGTRMSSDSTLGTPLPDGTTLLGVG